jgi:nucleotide-binding universal stress UspA family protein
LFFLADIEWEKGRKNRKERPWCGIVSARLIYYGMVEKNLTREANMRPIERVVVPVDFAYHTDKLVDYAAYLAGTFAAVTHYIHVVEFYPGNSMTPLSYVREYEEKLLADVRARMSQLLQDNRERCKKCIGKVIVGDPVETIIDYARAQDADLIIMGTHGSKGLEKILLGSVAERVLKGAHCPVLIMNPFRK